MHLEEYLKSADIFAHRVDAKSCYALARDLFTAWKEGHTVFTCGNGGSAANASHLAQDLSKGTWQRGASALRTICLNDNVSALTAYANDEGYEHVFARQLGALGQQSDILIAISGSGNSPNILTAICSANTLGMRAWGVTGFDGGELIDIALRCVHVPCSDMGMVESAHSLLFHWLVDYLKGAFEASMYHKLDELVAWSPAP